MNTEAFTLQAELLWLQIPAQAREQILAHVFCVRGRTSVQIVGFCGMEGDGNLVLKGKCKDFGYEVVRMVETSELDRSNN
jgi:hypothetical protein